MGGGGEAREIHGCRSTIDNAWEKHGGGRVGSCDEDIFNIENEFSWMLQQR